jgi:spermidine/putrescine-binding protein
VLGYNKETFANGKQPKSWAEFWDVEKFPSKTRGQPLQHGRGQDAPAEQVGSK